jgi:signal transduction histidine kinase
MGFTAVRKREVFQESVPVAFGKSAALGTKNLADALTAMENEVALCKNKQEMLRVLSLKLLRTQDEDRRRIARELHDTTGQTLAALKLALAKVQRDLEAHRFNPSLMKDADSLADQAIAEIRTTSHLLHPPLLDEIGFASAAKWFVKEFQKRSGIRVFTRVPRVALPKHVELVLFRVLQEGLTNVLRHSGATTAEVLLGHDDARVSLTIRDFGRGMPPDRLDEFQRNGTGVGVGLAGMRERVRELSGDLQLRSNHAGTVVSVVIPKA